MDAEQLAFGGAVPPEHALGVAETEMMMMADERSATLYRMVLPEHTCPFGVRAKEMLERSGFAIDEHILSSRDEVEAFKAEHGVGSTPQIFIGGKRIGGSDDLERHLRAA